MYYSCASKTAFRLLRICIIVIIFVAINPINNALSSESSLDELIDHLVDSAQSRLPIKSDAITTINGVIRLSDNRIQFRSSVDIDKMFILAAEGSNMTGPEIKEKAITHNGGLLNFLKLWSEKNLALVIKNQVCTTPGSIKMLDAGIALVYSFYTKDGTHFYEESFVRSDCL
jgi:hypothetical protein